MVVIIMLVMIPTCVVSLQPPAENVSQNNVLMQEMSTPLDQPSTYGKNYFFVKQNPATSSPP